MDDAYVTGRPAVPLRPFIERYIGYRMAGHPPGVHRGLPSRFATFIVSTGEPIDVIQQTDLKQSPEAYRCVLSGLQATPAMIAHHGNQEGVAIELNPAGIRALFGLPPVELWDATVELIEIDRVGSELWGRLQESADWQDRFDSLDRVLTARLTERRTRREIDRAWHLLAASGGTAPIDHVAHEVGWSRHHLTRQFRKEFGLGPKLAGRVIRFERAQSMLTSGQELARVAATCGYFDQAHMNRDFVELSGVSPARLVAERFEEVPSFQEQAA